MANPGWNPLTSKYEGGESILGLPAPSLSRDEYSPSERYGRESNWRAEPEGLEVANSAGGEQNPNAVLYEMFKKILSDYRTKRQLLRAMISYVKIELISITNITHSLIGDDSIYIQCTYQNNQDGNREATIEIRISRTNGISVIYINDTNHLHLNFNPQLALLGNGNVSITFDTNMARSNRSPVILNNDIRLAASLLTTISVFAKNGGQQGGKKSRKNRRSKKSRKSRKSRRYKKLR